MKLASQKIFITGGSAGIGKSLIEELSKYGVKKIAVMGRTAEKLDALDEQFQSVEFLKIQGNISRLDAVKKAAQAVKEEWGALDILVNNAGVVSAGLLEEISDEDIINQVNINVTGLILLTKHLLPLLKESSEGALINVSSGLGYIAMPFYSVYAATKAAVKHFSEAMRRELSDYPIHVMTVYPTATDTDMMETANVDREMDSPEKVAKATIKGLLNKEIEVVLRGQQRKDQIQAFQSVNYPILPSFDIDESSSKAAIESHQEIFHIRHHSLFAPRDFDVSPYFQIVKPTILEGFDPHRLQWVQED